MKPLIDINVQRQKLRALEGKSGQRAALWCRIQRLARENPGDNPWLLPFVALIDERPEDIARAKKAIDDYLNRAEKDGSSGYLFNIWCFAFPHARWAIWFDALRRAGFYTPEEVAAASARFLLIQFRDHHAGLLIKPFPECVDNQAASLVLASYVVGSLFAEVGVGEGHLARKMRDEASPRLEAMIGGMPASGYSGEGSTYQGLIVAFAVPLLTEMLEDLKGRDVFEAPLWPKGTSPRKILEMTRGCWTPGGLLLPWDDYGYQFGIPFPLAYFAHRTGDEFSLQLLEHEANWTRVNTISAGWGYDHLIWTLIYWPETTSAVPSPVWSSWAEDKLGAVLVDAGGENYLMQMWDPTGRMCCREHVNPNSLILSHKGIPFSADGDTRGGDVLSYPGAVFERSFGAGSAQKINLSKGCGGSHNCLLIDGEEGLRPTGDFTPSRLASFDAGAQSVCGDVTGLYRSAVADCLSVRRRSRLVENRFWLVEDLAAFSLAHRFTSRWWFRPDCRPAEGGVDVLTPEGGLLQLRSLLGGGEAEIRRIEGYPREPDGMSDRVDFQQSGSTARWLYLLWPSETLETARTLTDGWAASPVERSWGFEEIEGRTGGTLNLHPGTPPWFQQNVGVSADWAYRLTIAVEPGEPPLLRLPRGFDRETRLWLNGVPVSLAGGGDDRQQPQLVDSAEAIGFSKQLTILLATTFAVGQSGDGKALAGPDGVVTLCRRRKDPEKLKSWSYSGEELKVETTSGNHFRTPHRLMEEAPCTV